MSHWAADRGAVTGKSVERYLGVPGCVPDSRSSSGCGALWHHEQRPPAPVMGLPNSAGRASEGQLLQSRAFSKEPPACPQQSGRPATARNRNRPIVVTSDQSRPSNPPSFQVPIRLRPSLLPPVLSLFHPSHGPRRIASPLCPVRIALFDLLETRRICTPSRLQAIESESFS